MKKLALLLIVLLALSCLFVACKNEPEVTDPASPEVGKQRLIDQGSSARAIDHTGFNLDFTMKYGLTPEVTFAVGGKNDVYWLGTAGVYAFFCNHEGSSYAYVAGLLPSWIKFDDVPLADKIFTETFDDILFLLGSEEFKSYMKKTGNDSIGGRKCTVYSVSQDGVTAKAFIDIEYGFTLGLEVTEGGESLSFEITPTLSNPELPTGYAEAKACETFVDPMDP